MASLSPEERAHLIDYLIRSFDQDNAGDMETFAQNFLHSAAVWDLLADHFPNASASAVKSAMMEAFAQWTRKD